MKTNLEMTAWFNDILYVFILYCDVITIILIYDGEKKQDTKILICVIDIEISVFFS